MLLNKVTACCSPSPQQDSRELLWPTQGLPVPISPWKPFCGHPWDLLVSPCKPVGSWVPQNRHTQTGLEQVSMACPTPPTLHQLWLSSALQWRGDVANCAVQEALPGPSEAPSLMRREPNSAGTWPREPSAQGCSRAATGALGAARHPPGPGLCSRGSAAPALPRQP